MIFGRKTPQPRHAPAPAPAARPQASDGGIVFDRMTAVGVGVLLGLATVIFDGRRHGVARSGPPATPEAAEDGLIGIARRTIAEFTEDRIPAVAAGATFYALLALFPALGVFVSLYGLFADLGEAQRQIAGLHGLLPAGGVTVLSEQVTRLAAVPHANLGLTFAFSLVLSVWSSNAGVKAVMAGLNVAYEERERRNFVVLNLVSIAFTVGGIVFAMVSLATIVAVPELLARVGLETMSEASVLRWPAMLLVTAVVFSLLYRFGPSHHRPRWRWITPGGVLAALAWGAMSVGFSIYVSRFGHYDATYGSLGALAGFMTWIWLSLIVVLLGAELNCEIERRARARAALG